MQVKLLDEHVQSDPDFVMAMADAALDRAKGSPEALAQEALAQKALTQEAVLGRRRALKP